MRPLVESPEVAALEEILQSRDLAIAIQGPAGAGKTTFAAEAVRAIEALSGKDVMVLAPSSSAVNELRSRVTPKAETIQQFRSCRTLRGVGYCESMKPAFYPRAPDGGF